MIPKQSTSKDGGSCSDSYSNLVFHYFAEKAHLPQVINQIVQPKYIRGVIIQKMSLQYLPSLEDIYDFSSNDLTSLITRLEQDLSRGSASSQQRQRYLDYIENVRTQLEERKTLQFFQELCAIDNPYLQKMTEFNNQFLKLASQAIANQEAHNQPFSKKNAPLQGIVEEDETEQHHDGRSVNSRITDNTSYKSVAGEKASTVTSEKHSGVFSKGKAKNKMKDFIVSTLSKNKAEGCYIIKKAGNQPQKQQPNFTVNERGHVVSSSTLEPISMKAIKSSSNAKQRQQNTPSTKQITQNKNKVNEKQLQKKRSEAAEKVKHLKPQKKKEKNLNNKDLVEMIREQERQKEKKDKIKDYNLREEENNTQNEKQNQVIQKIKDESLQVENLFPNTKKKELVQLPKVNQIDKKQIETFSSEKVEQITQVIQNEDELEVKKETSSLQQIKQEIKVEQSQVIIKKTLKSQQNNQKPISQKKEKQQVFNKRYQLLEKQKKEQLLQQVQSEQPSSKIDNDKANEKIQAQRHFKQELQQLNKMREEIKNQKIRKQNLQIQKQKEDEQIKQAEIENNSHNNNQMVEVVKEKEIIQKKCYNQDYWIHIREQAEQQIKRFKQQKELEEFSKKSIRMNIQQAISVKQEEPPIQPQSTEQEEDDFIKKRKNELKKMMGQHQKRVAPKKSAPAVMAPARSLHPLPEFPYLQIYPTFNHIFSVMYTKAQHQALQDVPVLMKELTALFSTHVQHFKERAGVFRPAVFLPFDGGSFSGSDPRQLLLHAENTHVNLKKLVERLQIFNGNLQGQFSDPQHRYYRVVKTRQEVYDIISTGFLRRRGWKELPHGCSLRASWNLFWSWSKPDVDLSRLLVWQRVNHFPFNKNLSRKDLLYRNLDSFRKMLKVPFPFLPLTFTLPKEFTQFSIKFHEDQMLNRDHNYWIMKPIGKSRGRGIKVISSLAELNYTDNIIVQKYINDPLLLDGYKFDMRIYVLVTSFHPLEAFLYREGFARLSTQKFSLEPSSIKNTFVHLTNFAINKNNQEAKQTSAFSGGSKISLKSLKQKITKMGYSYPTIWSQVQQIIVKSLLGCSVSVPPFPAAFELFGYDIMIDTGGACHLIEINASPSLERSYMLDEVVKQSLIDDILDIVDPPAFDKQQLLDVLAERMSGRRKLTPQEDLIDIARVLKYQPLRKFGQMPQNMGLFEMLAPSKLSTDLEKLIRSRSGANNPKNID